MVWPGVRVVHARRAHAGSPLRSCSTTVTGPLLFTGDAPARRSRSRRRGTLEPRRRRGRGVPIPGRGSSAGPGTRLDRRRRATSPPVRAGGSRPGGSKSRRRRADAGTRPTRVDSSLKRRASPGSRRAWTGEFSRASNLGPSESDLGHAASCPHHGSRRARLPQLQRRLPRRPSLEVVAFTATQIPFIDDRMYPPSLAGRALSERDPRSTTSELRQLIEDELDVDDVVLQLLRT